VDAQEDVASAEHFRPGQCVGEKDGVTGWDVRDRNVRGHFLGVTAPWNLKFTRQGRPTENPQIDVDSEVSFDAQVVRDPGRSGYLVVMPLTVSEGQSVRPKSLMLENGESCRGVEATTE